MLLNKQAPNLIKQQGIVSYYLHSVSYYKWICIILALSLEPRPLGQPLPQHCLVTIAEGKEHGGADSHRESSVTSVHISLPMLSCMAKPDFKRMRKKNSPVGRGRDYWWTIIQSAILSLSTLFKITFPSLPRPWLSLSPLSALYFPYKPNST